MWKAKKLSEMAAAARRAWAKLQKASKERVWLRHVISTDVFYAAAGGLAQAGKGGLDSKNVSKAVRRRFEKESALPPPYAAKIPMWCNVRNMQVMMWVFRRPGGLGCRSHSSAPSASLDTPGLF